MCILNICRHDLIHMWTRTHMKSQNRNGESKHQHQFMASGLILAMFKKVFGVCLYAYFMRVHAERLVYFQSSVAMKMGREEIKKKEEYKFKDLRKSN